MSHFLTSIAFAALGLFLWYWKWRRSFIAHLPGPPWESRLVGNLASFERSEDATDAHFEWTKKYGTAFRVKGCLGENILYLSDPRALHYVFNKHVHNFPKTWEDRVRISLATGHGLIFAGGAQHARQRKLMNPAFSQSALKDYLPLFCELSRRTAARWRTLLYEQNAEQCVLNVLSLLACTTLDAIGEAAFGYKFNSIDKVEPETELHKAYKNLFVDVNYRISDSDILFRRLMGYIPLWVAESLTSLPKKDLQRLKYCKSVAYSVAKDLVEKQIHVQASGKECGRDVLSILVAANNAENPKYRLDEDEILSQIMTLMLAGHETSANTLSWTLYELSKHPEVQSNLRDEVRAIRADVASRGESEVTISDLDSMRYMIAVIKETLRYHPIFAHIVRRVGNDDIIPLDIPQQTVFGETITAIPVRKGQVLQLGMASYNRLKSVWGPDADEWRPERFLEELPKEHKTTLGIFGNILTFGSGLRSCIGWRFAILEMQTILTELIDNFEFNPAPNVEIKSAANVLVQSMVKGEEEKGTQMPLKVSFVLKHNRN